MTRIPAPAQESDHRAHQIDAAVSVLVRLLARQAARELSQASSPKDVSHDQD